MGWSGIAWWVVLLENAFTEESVAATRRRMNTKHFLVMVHVIIIQTLDTLSSENDSGNADSSADKMMRCATNIIL